MKVISQLAALTLLVILTGLFGTSSALAAGASGVHFEHANNELENTNSLQRGARNYMNYCVGCHSLKFVRYNRISEDLGLTEQQLRDNLIFGVDKINQNVTTAMTNEQAKQWFNAVPPDLSLTGRSKGPDWIFTYLKSFYRDNSRTFGVNNLVLPGSSMPHVLWELQGMQDAVYRTETVTDEDGVESQIEIFDNFTLAEPGTLTAEEYDAFVRDTVNFLDYVGEPMQIKRQTIGMMVLGFLAIFGLLAYALKKEYWKDIH